LERATSIESIEDCLNRTAKENKTKINVYVNNKKKKKTFKNKQPLTKGGRK